MIRRVVVTVPRSRRRAATVLPPRMVKKRPRRRKTTTSGPVHGAPAQRRDRCWPALSKSRSKGSAVAVVLAVAVAAAAVLAAMEAAAVATVDMVGHPAVALTDRRHRDTTAPPHRLDNMVQDHRDTSVEAVRRLGRRGISEDAAPLRRAGASQAVEALVDPLRRRAEASAAGARPMATGEVAVVRAGEALVVEDDSVVVEEEDGSKMIDLPLNITLYCTFSYYSYFCAFCSPMIVPIELLTPPPRHNYIEFLARLLEDVVETSPDVDRIVIEVGTFAVENAAVPEYFD